MTTCFTATPGVDVITTTADIRASQLIVGRNHVAPFTPPMRSNPRSDSSAVAAARSGFQRLGSWSGTRSSRACQRPGRPGKYARPDCLCGVLYWTIHLAKRSTTRSRWPTGMDFASIRPHLPPASSTSPFSAV